MSSEPVTYTPSTPWRNQDPSPRPVPAADSDGNPWQVTGDGRHVGTHNGMAYCLEWLPADEGRRNAAREVLRLLDDADRIADSLAGTPLQSPDLRDTERNEQQ